MNDKKIKKRILMAFIGVIVSGLAVGLFRNARFGTDPFQVFVNGISNKVTFMDFGTLYMLINLLMLLLIFLLNKHHIGISTFVNIFLLGYVVQFSDDVVAGLVGDSPSMPVRIALLAAGLVILCFASAMYFTADLGVSTYDAVSLDPDGTEAGKIPVSADYHGCDLRYCGICPGSGSGGGNGSDGVLYGTADRLF